MSALRKKPGKGQNGREKTTRAPYISQSDVQSYSLEETLRVPTAIQEHYGGHPVTPLQLAHAMMMQPNSGRFRQLCGAAVAYGLTSGGCNSKEIALEALGKRIVRGGDENDALAARRESVLRARVVRAFLEKYDRSPPPREDIALHVLADLGVPKERAARAYELIIENAATVHFFREIKGRRYVELDGSAASPQSNSVSDACVTIAGPTFDQAAAVDTYVESPTNGQRVLESQRSGATSKRVYISHGKNRAFIEPIKKLLAFGEMVPIVSVENQSVAKPVPDKVLDDMRGCGAAIIHVDAEKSPSADNDAEFSTVNPNVLIEIGAAMALFGRRFILLVRDGVRLPTNLQGLFEVRYSNPALDGETTIRLLDAINDIKNHPLPKLPTP